MLYKFSSKRQIIEKVKNAKGKEYELECVLLDVSVEKELKG